MLFSPKQFFVDRLQVQPTALEIEREPMLYRASFPFAAEQGGPLTAAFLANLCLHSKALGIGSLQGLVIDSRTHMLLRGHYPCIPGWHHDDVPRNTPNGQPNYDDPPYRARHLMVVLDAIDAPTGAMPQFLESVVDVPWPLDEQAVIYAAWDAHINALDLLTHTVSSGAVWGFDCGHFHRGMPAKRHGWRFFIRATWDTQVQAEDKIRRNANVYVPWSTAGW